MLSGNASDVDHDGEETDVEPTLTPTTEGPAPDADPDGGSPDAVIEVHAAAFNSGDIDLVMSFFGEDSVIIGDSPEARTKGLEQIRAGALDAMDIAADTDSYRISIADVAGDSVTWDHQFTTNEDEVLCFTDNRATVEDGRIITWTSASEVDCSPG